MLFFIFKGWGLLILIYGLAALLIPDLVGNVDAPFTRSLWIYGVSMILAAGLTFLTRMALVSDKVLECDEDNTIFFMPMNWWTWIYLGIGILLVTATFF